MEPWHLAYTSCLGPNVVQNKMQIKQPIPIECENCQLADAVNTMYRHIHTMIMYLIYQIIKLSAADLTHTSIRGVTTSEREFH